jgi:hypothetical protein
VRIAYLGSEVPSNRQRLLESGVTAFGWSYMRAKKRGFPKTKRYTFSDYYPDGSLLIVHPGISEIPDDLVDEAAVEYEHFIVEHIDEITGFVEFNHPAQTQQWREQQRRFWEQAGEKFWPVWDGTRPGELHDLGQRFAEVAIPGTVVDEQMTLAGQTRGLTAQYRTVWHGMAISSPENLRQVPFSTASTGSWQSPMRRGETIVWDGMSLKRYPKKMKDQARPRYKRIIEQAGLDYDAILADDAKEVTRLAIWSYQQLEKNMDKKKPSSNPFRVIEGGGDPDADTEELITGLVGWSDDDGSSDDGVDNRGVEVRKPESTVPAPREAAEKRFLPSMGVDTKTVVEPSGDGTETLRDVPVLTSTGSSMRQCNTCFVAANCPAFKPDSECAFHLPVQIRTRDQLRSLLEAMIEIQASRVAFSKFAEDLNGGYPDPNTSQEMDRLFKLVGQLKDMEANKERLSITMERQGSAGVLSAIFGDRAASLRDLPAPIDSTTILSEGLER